MKRRILGAIVCLLGAVAVPGPAAGTAKPDWLLVRATAGGKGAAVFIEMHARGHTTPRGPFVFGQGFASRSGSFVGVRNFGRDGVSATSTSEAGGQAVRLAPAEANNFRIDAEDIRWLLRPGETLAILWFVGNGAMDRVSVRHELGLGLADFDVRTGSGSTAMSVAGPASDGVAAAAGPLGAGSSRYAAASRRGLVGAFEFSCEGSCTGAWRGPGGREGSWSWTGEGVLTGLGEQQGQISFAGPAGRWSWDWTGVAVSPVFFPYFESPRTGSPVIGAWAPIGDGWRLFDRPGRP